MQYITSQISACSVATELTELVSYFDATYVSGQVRSIHHPDDGELRVRYVFDVLHRCFHQLCGMFMTKRLRMAN